MLYLASNIRDVIQIDKIINEEDIVSKENILTRGTLDKLVGIINKDLKEIKKQNIHVW